jgi:hypothetical protein
MMPLSARTVSGAVDSVTLIVTPPVALMLTVICGILVK